MTKREKLIVSAYTGICMARMSDLQEYIGKLLNRPVFTHELADEDVVQEIMDKTKSDFISLCENDTEESKHGEWVATGWMKETSPRQFQFRCSNCDKEKRQPRGKVWLTKSQKKPRYCVCCGARMDGGKNVR